MYEEIPQIIRVTAIIKRFIDTPYEFSLIYQTSMSSPFDLTGFNAFLSCFESTCLIGTIFENIGNKKPRDKPYKLF